MRTHGDPHWQAFRQGFPALSTGSYLSICDKAILHDRVRAQVEVFLDKLAYASASRVDHETRVASAKQRFARLVGARADEIAFTRNVSDGINAIAWSLPLGEGDNIVVSLDAEHPNNAYPWLRQARRGVELRSVPCRDGALDIDAMCAAIDARTRLVTCASVSFAPGLRADLARIGAVARTHDSLFLVDGVQSAGTLAHDLSAMPVDAFATSTSKGLLGLYGGGFLYVAERWIDRLEPAYLSRTGVAMETEDASSMGAHDYALRADAGRFEVGSYNLAAAYAVDAALEMLLELTPAAIERRVLETADALRETLHALGAPGVTMADGVARSGIVTAGQLDAGGHGVSRTAWVVAASAALNEAKVAHTIRRGQLRFGVHAYNDATDVAHVADVLRAMRPAA